MHTSFQTTRAASVRIQTNVKSDNSTAPHPMSLPRHTLPCLALLIALLACVAGTHAKTPLAEAVARMPAVKALREKLEAEALAKQAVDTENKAPNHPPKFESKVHEHDTKFFSCGTPINKGTTRSYGRDQGKPEFPGTVCQETICDDPKYVLGYADALSEGKVEKVTARVKVYSIGKDDFSEPFSNPQKSAFQQSVMNQHFESVNVDFVLEDFVINSTYLWYGEITPEGCPIDKLGDGVPDYECLNVYNGFDGGDWLCPNPATCNPICTWENIMNGLLGTEYCECICVDYSECDDMVGNGVCDDICNVGPKQFDGGDCCNDPSLGKCFDFNRPLFQRSFADIIEIREYAKSNFSTSFYIYVGSMKSTSILGISVFPWTIDFSESSNGGFLMEELAWRDGSDSSNLGTVVSHEAGHSFGLWHTFHGVTELNDDCLDPCYEAQYAVGAEGTMLKGDMCADTRPTPINYICSDPLPCPAGVFDLTCADCKNKPWVDTPVQNIMGYSILADECDKNSFSPQQSGRARCYYDLYYSDWDDSPLPGQIVLPPSTVRVSSSTVKISWEAPLNKGSAGPVHYLLRRVPPFSEGDIPVFTTSYLDTNATNTVKYSYMVKAANDAGESPFFGKMQEEKAASSESDSGISSGAIAGIAVGGTVGVVAIAGAAAFAIKRRKTDKSLELNQIR